MCFAWGVPALAVLWCSMRIAFATMLMAPHAACVILALLLVLVARAGLRGLLLLELREMFLQGPIGPFRRFAPLPVVRGVRECGCCPTNLAVTKLAVWVFHGCSNCDEAAQFLCPVYGVEHHASGPDGASAGPQ